MSCPSRRHFVIYAGKILAARISQGCCFRIGSIGRLDERDFDRLLAAVEEVLEVMGIAIPGSL